MDKISNILNTFEPITLNEMGSVELFNRVDTKFIFNKQSLPVLLEKINNNYRVLDINNVRLNKYETLYFDTDNYDLYRHHHRGSLSRYKVRYRRYTDTNKTFFEVKLKNNKEQTIKERIQHDNLENDISLEAEGFLNSRIKIKSSDLKSKLWVFYTRIILVNKHQSERVTIDLSLNFKDINKNISFPSLVIAEVKQEKAFKSPITGIMKEMHLRSASVSKYCLGVAMLNDEIKQNNFKDIIKLINKLNHNEQS